MLVMMDVSVVRAIAGSGGRSNMKRLTNSAAICWASAALPPFPQIMSLRSPVKAEAIRSERRKRFRAFSLTKSSVTFTVSRSAFSMILSTITPSMRAKHRSRGKSTAFSDRCQPASQIALHIPVSVGGMGEKPRLQAKTSVGYARNPNFRIRNNLT
jgi:hypothetical protein